MADNSFDIRTLHDFNPPQLLCQWCHAILFEFPCSFEAATAACPNCRVEYFPGVGQFEHACLVGDYLQAVGCGIKFNDPLEHARKLARIVALFENSLRNPEAVPPFRLVLEALNAAQQFVHFTTWGMDLVMIGVLKLLATRVSVRGVISNATENVAQEIKEAQREAPNLKVRVFERGESFSDTPHSKLIVVDGLLMFSGSANLTTTSWRGVAKNDNQMRADTRVATVAEQNNRYFSTPFVRDLPCRPIEMCALPF